MMNKTYAVMLIVSVMVLAFGSVAMADVNIETVPVGNAGNTADGTGHGAVDYEYNIGKYEVTAGQYTEFLNTVAATDTYGLYSYGCKIQRSGSSGSYTYSVAGEWANRPVNQVSFWDACRFANWLHNGQGSGDTETGAYTLTADGITNNTVTRNTGWKWAVTSEDEWYKAAYHKNDGVTGNYYDYPTSSDAVPSNDLINPDPGNNATFYDNGYTIGSPYYRTEVGAHENSESPYGTFDQGGNVWEWNEAIINPPYRGFRGASFGYYDIDRYMRAAYRCSGNYAESDSDLIGFRVSEEPAPPQPQTHVLTVGVRCEEGFVHGGDVNAVRVKDAFAQLPRVDNAWFLGLNTADSNNSQQITAMVNAMKAKVNPGDTFVFYLNGHGYEDSATDEVITAGDERFYLSFLNSSDDMTDDTFSSLFQTDEWNQVSKLFIIDTCYAGGFIGSTANGDSGDLTQLPKFALFAACDEDETSAAVYDSESDTHVGALGKALIAALNELQDQDVITFQDLYDETARQGSFLVGSNGRIQGFKDMWDDEVVVDFDLGVETSNDFAMDDPFVSEPATVIPEPLTIVGVSVGVLGLLGYIRKRK